MTQDRIDDETLRRYLLGRAPEDMQERIGALLVSDDDNLAQRLSALESDLVDHRIRGDRGAGLDEFRERFHWTTRRRRKLGMAVHLSGMEQDEVQAAWAADGRDGLARRFARWLGRVVPSPRWGGTLRSPAWAAVAVASMVVITGLLSFQAGRINQMNRLVSESWLTVAVATRGGDIQEVRLTGAPLVRLKLDIGIDEATSYRAELYADETEAFIWRRDLLFASTIDSRVAVTLDLPSDLLTPGGYHVVLRGIEAGSEPRYIDRYVFRAVGR